MEQFGQPNTLTLQLYVNVKLCFNQVFKDYWKKVMVGSLLLLLYLNLRQALIFIHLTSCMN